MQTYANILTKLRRWARDTRGATLVEFAIVAPFFLIIVIGIIDFGRLFWVKSTMQFAVEEAARYAMVNSDASTADLEAYATSEASMLSGITFSASSSTSSGVEFRTITASYTFSFLIPIIPVNGITLSAKSTTPVSEE